MNYNRIAAAALCLCLTAPMALSLSPADMISALTLDENIKEEISDIYMYKNYGDHAEITAVSTTAEGDIIVPDSIAGVPVKIIGDHAFAGVSKITSVTLPKTVTSLGKQAFSYCTSLTDVNIPPEITEINDETFMNCMSLGNVALPENLEKIGIRAFYNCQKMTEVNIPDSVSFMGESAFSNCTGLTEFNIPKGVTALEKTLLNGCKSITHLAIPKNVESIAVMALPSGLKSLYIANPELDLEDAKWSLVPSECILYVPAESKAREFAEQYGFQYELTDGQDVPEPGDVNDDMYFTIADVVMMQEYLLGKSELIQPLNGDMNNDDTIDLFDFILMRQIIPNIPIFTPDDEYTAKLLSKEYEADDVSEQPADENFIMGQTEFALSVLQNELKADGNTLVSPYSIMQALAMTANGAVGNTKDEMEKVLGGMPIEQLDAYLNTQRLSQPNTDTCKLSTANSIWIRDDGRIAVYPEFLQTNADYFGADVFNAPFDQTTVTDINNWVNTKTNNMIPELIKKISDEAAMYLINAVAFEADWEEKYTEYSIGKYNFTAIDGSVQNCEMMNSKEHFYIEDENAVGFYKYYEGRRYAFAAILPDEGISVNDYVSGLTAESLNDLLSTPQYGNVVTRLPKFSFDYETELNDSLSKMGMPTAFDKELADFTQIGKTYMDILYINKVKHKTHITVDEAGTKAGAVTSIEMNAPTSVDPGIYKEIILDRPFLFCIVDTETDLPVFMGTLTNVN